MASLVLPSLFSHNDKKQKILEKIGGQFVPDRVFVFMNMPICTCTAQLINRDWKCLVLCSRQWNSIAVEGGGAGRDHPTLCNSEQIWTQESWQAILISVLQDWSWPRNKSIKKKKSIKVMINFQHTLLKNLIFSFHLLWWGNARWTKTRS